MNAPAPTTTPDRTDYLRVALLGAGIGAGFVVFTPLLCFVAASVVTTLMFPEGGVFKNAYDLQGELNEFFAWPWQGIIPVSAIGGAAFACSLIALGRRFTLFLDRRHDAEQLRITTCEACNGPKTMEGDPAIWVCADPTCITRERAWWER